MRVLWPQEWHLNEDVIDEASWLRPAGDGDEATEESKPLWRESSDLYLRQSKDNHLPTTAPAGALHRYHNRIWGVETTPPTKLSILEEHTK